MSDIKRFLKSNKVKKEDVLYPATKSLLDDEGNPLLWRIRTVTTRDDERIRESCMKEIPIKGRPGAYRQKLNTTAYLAKLIVLSITEPNLNSAELQDNYGVKNPEDLIKEMIDNPGEYNELAVFVQKHNGFTTTLQEKIDEAKNE